MLAVYGADRAAEWNALVQSFENWDVYYLYEYARSFQVHGDGEPFLLFYQDAGSRFCYVVMKRDIAADPCFQGELEPGRFFDLETPYGYGGPLCDGGGADSLSGGGFFHAVSIPAESQVRFSRELLDYCAANGLVSQFIRFHPLLGNYTLLPSVMETRYLRDTIYMDTLSPERILSNMDSKNRNMVRKARKNNLIVERRAIADYPMFLALYRETMARDGANAYYSFQENYFQSLQALGDFACIFYALWEDTPVSGAVMLGNDRFLHYHLAGTDAAFRKYAPGNLLLYEAALWASGRGIRAFHLGGGLSPDDSLFAFKKQFNKHGRLPFFVGRTVFDHPAYETLLRLRKERDPAFDMDNGRMIQYRA